MLITGIGTDATTAIAKLKVRGAVTTRNWNTVQKLAALLAQ
jgi:uncharacterized protein (DUF1697 family)